MAKDLTGWGQSYWTKIGGRLVSIARDSGCSADVGNPPCAEPVTYWFISPANPDVERANPDLRGYVAISPQCERHGREVLAEIPDAVYVEVS